MMEDGWVVDGRLTWETGLLMGGVARKACGRVGAIGWTLGGTGWKCKLHLQYLKCPPFQKRHCSTG